MFRMKLRKILPYISKKVFLRDKPGNDVDHPETQVTRHRPEGIDSLCRTTKFSRKELQILYRGFKQLLSTVLSRLKSVQDADRNDILVPRCARRHKSPFSEWNSSECPSGLVNEETFKEIYAQFFPQGDSSAYAHFVFNAFDQDRSGAISFEEFVSGLSVLSRGTLHEKLQWAFSLYDTNGDGIITKDEMLDIVSAIYDLMGKFAEPSIDDRTAIDHVDRVFQNMDVDRDGIITIEEFMERCRTDETISQSMAMFDTVL